MTIFPPNAKDGQLHEADNGVYYVYNAYKNVWQSNNVVPKWADQVFIRGVENQTQQNVNDVNKAVNNKVGSIAAGTNQLVEVAFDVKTRGIWKHQSGPVAPGDPPVGLQCFLIEDVEGGKTQQYDEAAVLVIHAMGGGEKDKVAIGATEIGDLITIQNQNDLQGGSYIVTGIEEFESDDPNELTDAYARYTVTVNEKATTGMFSADEMVTIRIFPRPTEGMGVDDYDGRYLQLKAPNDVNNQFRIKGTGGTYISTAGDELGIYHLKTPTDVTHAASKGYVDQQIAAIEIPTGGGGLPTTKYDGNRLFVVGNGVSDLNNGEVVFTNSSGNIVDTVALVTRIVLPIDEFNWDACSKSGFVYVKNGANSRGYFQVYDVITNEGRNKMLKVKLFDFVEDTNLDPGYGHPCYFNGVFFG